MNLRIDTKNPDASSSSNHDVQGNASDEVKQTCIKAFRFFISTPGNSYGADIGQRFKLVELNIWDEGLGRSASAQTVVEITVEKDMCNVFETLHGACAAYIVDPCSVSSLVALGTALGFDGSGFSQSMNLIWHQPIKSGTKLRVVSTTMSVKGKIRTMRSELWDGKVLCMSAVHSTVHPGNASHKTLKGKL